MHRRFVLTGPPGSGKTTVLRELAKEGIVTVAEAATDVIADSQAVGVVEPWSDTGFTERIVQVQRERQIAADSARAQVTLYDRSPICTLALARYLGHPVGQNLRAELHRICRDRPYEKVVLFVEPIGQVEPTAARQITYEESLRFGDLHRETYAELGYELVDVPAASVEARAALIRRAIEFP